MSTGVNPTTRAGISIGSSLGSLAEWLRQITVRVAGSGNSHGSGVLWNAKGLIVTNAHVVRLREVDVELREGRTVRARLVARDPKIDLALLAVDAGDLDAASVRSASGLRAGEVVVAAGNPWDSSGAVSTGVVHRAVGKLPWIVSDVRLAPGNSGGPLADAQGNVVGINSMVVDGLGWAVTSDAVVEFLRTAQPREAA